MSGRKQQALIPRLRFPEFRNAGPWEVRRLGEIGPVSMCRRIMKAQTAPTGDVPFYKIGTFGKKADAYISKDIYEKFKSEYPFPKKGDILISAAGTIGRTVVYDGKPAYFQDSNIVWIANNEKISLNKYLNFVYQIMEWKTDDNTISRLYNETLRSIKIPLPSLPEQQKIADCLSSLDELIKAEEAQLEALRQHKKGLMQKLFPAPGETIPRLRFPEFRNAGPWEVKRLGDVLSLEYGEPLPEKQRGAGPFPVVGSNGVVGYHSEALIEGPAIVIGRKGSAGETNWIESDCFPIDTTFYVVLLRHGDKLDFVKYLLERHKLPNLVNPSSVPGLNRDDVYALRTTVPQPEEQQKIADCLSSLDELIQAKMARIETLKTHKRGLMQQLFPQQVGGGNYDD